MKQTIILSITTISVLFIIACFKEDLSNSLTASAKKQSTLTDLFKNRPPYQQDLL